MALGRALGPRVRARLFRRLRLGQPRDARPPVLDRAFQPLARGAALFPGRADGAEPAPAGRADPGGAGLEVGHDAGDGRRGRMAARQAVAAPSESPSAPILRLPRRSTNASWSARPPNPSSRSSWRCRPWSAACSRPGIPGRSPICSCPRSRHCRGSSPTTAAANDARGAEAARLLKDDRILYHVASGPCAPRPTRSGSAILMEMLWLHSNPIDAAEFFHGPFEIVDARRPLVLIRRRRSEPAADGARRALLQEAHASACSSMIRASSRCRALRR